MKAFEISGDNGTYFELENGLVFDSVTGDSDAPLEDLRTLATDYTDKPMHATMDLEALKAYVGA